MLWLATSADWPTLFDDDQPLLARLRARGIDARAAIWDDPTVDWDAAELIVLRSIWDYTRERDRFLSWVRAASGTTPMHNPPDTVAWNTHKHYLRDLEQDGVRIVPSAWIDAGMHADVRRIAAERGWTELVVKPCVSAGARDTVRGDAAAAQRHVDALLAQGRDVMVQPYLTETEQIGEHSLVLLGGELSHVMRKEPALTPHEGWTSSMVRPVEPHPDEVALAARIMQIVGPLLYARVDALVIDDHAHLMELEVIEPQLFLRAAPPSATERFADLIEQMLPT